jgi:hypothetical protein
MLSLIMSEMDNLRSKQWELNQEKAAKELADHESIITKFKERCVALDPPICDLQINYLYTIGIVACAEELVKSLCPELVADKDGLYDLVQLRELFQRAPFPGTGLLIGDQFMIMAHPFFRRGMHGGANWESRFIELFWKLDLPKTRIRVALDIKRVRLDVRSFGYLEFDTWHGAKFNKEIAGIKDGLSQLRPPADIDKSDLDFFFASAYSLNIKWSTQGNIKTFQAEAYLQDNVLYEWQDNLWHPVRYVHAEFDLLKNCFTHFDGAIHFYDRIDYKVMREADLNYNLKHAEQIKAPAIKLFRLDDYIPLEEWLELTSQFFAHNPLIIEYFDSRYPAHLEEILTKIRSAEQSG